MTNYVSDFQFANGAYFMVLLTFRACFVAPRQPYFLLWNTPFLTIHFDFPYGLFRTFTMKPYYFRNSMVFLAIFP